MKKSLLKNNFREISKNKRRFISMLVMAFLGVGFFAGLVATSPDMLDSLDKYADKSNFYDINIISTLGITDDDIQAVKNIDGVENAYGIQTKDSMVKIDNKESVCKVIEYNENVNTPVVIAGRQIENDNECLLDNAIVRTGTGVEKYIGKKIVLENNDKDSDDNDIFTKKEFEIVGIVDSPMYISSERGNTSIGNGTVNFYIYTKDNVINLDYYTGMYVTVAGAKEQVTNSDGYLELVNPVIDKIEGIKQEREDAKVAIAMSLCQVTEGALPFAFNDPKRVIPAVTIGSGVAHGLILTWGVTVPVLHGGIFSVPLASNPMLWIAAWLIGAMVTAVIVSVTKPARPVETVHEDEELKDDFDIEIG